jgi:hypothetical protein
MEENSIEAEEVNVPVKKTNNDNKIISWFKNKTIWEKFGILQVFL